RDVYDVRKYLVNHGFYIFFEDIIKENNKFYFIIKFKRGKENYSDLELKYGSKVSNKVIFNEYLENIKKKICDNLNKINNSSNSEEKRKMLTSELERLTEYENN
ncbi:MAG TPA: hypothetical protein DDW20_04120, partial [Firmicutes bacterium]|nr:hypothetical protein [Bacillota bacterium]